MTDNEYKRLLETARAVSVVLSQNGIVLLADYLREYNKKKRKKIPFSTAAQACREGRIPAIQIGSRGTWLVPRGAIEAAREAGFLTGARGRPAMKTMITGRCPACGREVHGTPRGATVKHHGPDGKVCAGWKRPLAPLEVIG